MFRAIAKPIVPPAPSTATVSAVRAVARPVLARPVLARPVLARPVLARPVLVRAG
jgi:hypothetical protein